jgi:receptor protein-tyrosine kinase
LSPHGFLRVLQRRWLTIVLTAALVVLGALLLAWRTAPVYEASTTLFVSSRAGQDTSDVYEGGLFSAQRVQSYAELIEDDTLALRTIGKLGLTMTTGDWKEQVTAGAKPGTVLIDVRVRDTSPVRARDIANTLSDEFVVMVGELETPRPGDVPDARVIVAKRASLPAHPVVRQPVRNTALGLALGLVLGTGIAMLRDRRDNTVKTTEDVEEISGTALFATIPFDKRLAQSPCITFADDRSPTAEAFRTLRANLQFLKVDDPPRVLLVTCSQTGDGKSTTAVNLALALAQAGRSVALVDGDLRRPDLHNILGLDNSVGFSNVLSGQESLDEALQPTGFAGLWALTSGRLPPNPGEILGSSAAQNLCAQLRTRFDHVIMDSAPLLEFADAAILAADCDGVLLVSRADITRRDRLAQAVRRLEKIGAPVVGAVLIVTPERRDIARDRRRRDARKTIQN